jgi:dipeptidyl-peptidase 4
VIGLGVLLGCAGRRALPADATPGDSFLEQWAATRRFAAGRPTAVRITPDGRAVLFLRSGPRSFVQDLLELDTTTGRERVLLRAEDILAGTQEQLTAEERARRERMRNSARGISSYDLSADGTKLLVPLAGRLFVLGRKDRSVVEPAVGEGSPLDARFSPDGLRVAFVRDGELHVVDVPRPGAAPTRPVQLTHGASATLSHGLAEFVAQEEMGRFSGYWWSPDSRTIAYQETDTAGVEQLHIADPMHPDRPAQAWAYPRPGKTNARVRLGLIAATGGATVWVDWNRERHPYLGTVTWSENAPLAVLVQNREQTEEALLRVDTTRGTTTTLLVEKDDAWLNLDPQMPRWFGGGFLWTTERNGGWQLELRGADGALLRAVTRGDFAYRGLVDLDEAARKVVVIGGEDPTQRRLYRVGLDDGNAIELTDQRGVHGALCARDHATCVHSFSGPEGDFSQRVERDGRAIADLRSVAERAPVPCVELTSVGDSPRFLAAIVRPRRFESGRRYPVIDSVYGGPGAQTVTAATERYVLLQWIADHGFIVVSLDGRGTPGRGRAWERAIKGNLIDVPLGDQVAGLRLLGRRYPEMDLSRVGIYGWSFGGYFSAMAVMRRPDVFRAGVAGAPVADWLDYDTHYTERYLGLPDRNPTGYQRSSALTWAKDLSRPLLIVHGTADDNVYFAHSLKLSDALFRAGRAHEFLPLSGFTHMVPDPAVTERLYERIVGFLQDHVQRAP